MELERTELTFGVAGEFLTQITREWFYSGEKDIEKIMEILMGCMEGTDETEAEIRRHAQDILIGRAALKGNTADGTYHLEVYGPEEEEQLPGNMNIWKMPKKKKEIEKDLEKMADRFETAMSRLSDRERREVRKELGEETIEDRDQKRIDSFITRMMDDKEHTTGDYGWLDPSGKFYEADWGEHQEWAQAYIDENFPEETERMETVTQSNCNVGLIGAGDWLVERGWVLMHNPSQGVAFPTKNPVREYTKAQKEFLYDYYMERKCEDEANAIWDE